MRIENKTERIEGNKKEELEVLELEVVLEELEVETLLNPFWEFIELTTLDPSVLGLVPLLVEAAISTATFQQHVEGIWENEVTVSKEADTLESERR